MTDVKIYECKICERIGKFFKSNRSSIRRHLREVHGIKGTSFVKKGKGSHEVSNVTLNTLSEIML